MSGRSAGRGGVGPRLLREQAAEPARFWIRYAPRRWPVPAVPWLDLAAGTLGMEMEPDPSALEALRSERLADLLYLPPVPAPLAARRDALAAAHAARGTPVLVQLLPGDPEPVVAEPHVVVWDLLPWALAVAAQAELPGLELGPGHAAAWPLLPGSGAGEALSRVAAAVAAQGIGALQGLALDLAPHQRRSLAAALPERAYLTWFHAAPAAPAAVVNSARAAGLAPLLPRPLPRPPLHGAGNLRLAGVLAALGELLLRLGEPEPRAQALLRAARFAERLPQDLEALARERNLGVLPWLEGEPRALLAALAAGERPPLLEELGRGWEIHPSPSPAGGDGAS